MSIVVIIGLIFVIIAILIFIAGKNINQNTNQRILVDEFEELSMKMVKVYGLKNTSLDEVKAMIKLVNNELDKDETSRTCMSSPGAAFKISLEVLKVQEMAGKNFVMKHLQYLIQRGV